MIKEILLLHHSHLDVGYTHSQPIAWELHSEYLSQTIEWLEETRSLPVDSRPKWTCEVTEPVLRWLRSAHPGDVARFSELCRSGRIGFGGLRWHSTALADRAGLERLLDGKRELERLLGIEIKTACQHDVTGVSWALSDVLLDGGIDFFVMAINIHLGKASAPRPGMFLWETPTGRRLRVWNGNHYTMADQLLHTWDDSVESMAKGWERYDGHLKALNYPFDFFYLTSTCAPVMWDNAPNNPYLPELITRWNKAQRGPRVRYATFEDLRRRAMAVPDSELPVIRGDWTDYWSFGAGSSPVATARNQRAKALIRASEVIQPVMPARANDLLVQAKERADAYDEHTFGYYDSDPAHPQAQSIELLKQAEAHTAHELAAFSLMDGLEKLAENSPAARGIKGILLCNPGDQEVSVLPEAPKTWLTTEAVTRERTYRASRMFFDGRSWDCRFPGTDSRQFGVVTLPARSWRVLDWDELSKPGTATVSHAFEVETVERREINFAAVANSQRRVGRIESPAHRLRYDPDSGRVLSLVDKAFDRDLLPDRSLYDVFAFVRERPNPLIEDRRYAYYQRDLEKEKFDQSCWQPWTPIREQAERCIRCDVEVTPGRVTLEREFQAPGVSTLIQRISLFGHDPVIAVDIEMELLPNAAPQGFYFALPLKMASGWKASFDSAGVVVNADEDQLAGACRNWVTAESFAALWNGDFGVALFTPDAPNVQLGDFHFGPPLDQLPRPENPLLLAWPANNYWDTNVPHIQSGRIRLRYGIMTFQRYEAGLIRKAAEVFRQPNLVWPVVSNGKGAGTGTLG